MGLKNVLTKFHYDVQKGDSAVSKEFRFVFTQFINDDNHCMYVDLREMMRNAERCLSTQKCHQGLKVLQELKYVKDVRSISYGVTNGMNDGRAALRLNL